MAARYSTAQLLHLRESPLVYKPASLPPSEEWMGPLPDPSTRRRDGTRGKNDGSFSQHEGRPSLLETRHASRGSNSVPQDIVLGPPKVAFVSASSIKMQLKSYESPSRGAFGGQDMGTPRGEVFGGRGQEKGERRDGEDGRGGDLRNITGAVRRDEADRWSGPASARGFGRDDGDGSYRRTRDVNGKDTADGYKSQSRGFESFRRDAQRDGDDKRNGSGRGGKPSWFNDDEERVSQINAASRPQGWQEENRNDRRNNARDWQRNERAEQDPEWMSEPAAHEKPKKHTAEDIEQWKATMKAQAGGEQKPAIPAEVAFQHIRTASGANVARKIDISLGGMEPGADKFFALFNQPQSRATPTTNDSQGPLDDLFRQDGARPAASAPAKSSKFSGFFSPKPIVGPTEPPPARATPPGPSQHQTPPIPPFSQANDTADDRAGFQRILQMLGGGNVPLPSSQQPSMPTTTTSHSNHRDRTPPRSPLMNNTAASPPILSPRSRKSHGLENLLGSKSPREASMPPNSDSEFLLNLMMRPREFDLQQSGQAQKIGEHGQGMQHQRNQYPVRAMHVSPDGGMDPVFSQENSYPREKVEKMPEFQNHRGPSNFEEIYGEAQRGPQMDQYGDFGGPFQPAPPPGIQRPPGFDHFPAGFPPHVQQPRMSMVAPPPGFAAPNRNPSHFPPGLLPGMGNMNLGPDRGPSGGRPGVPPGMPPPNFMHGQGPPGFSPMGMPPPDGRISPTRQMMYGGPGGQHVRPPMDAFGDPNFMNANGRSAFPGQQQYRRQE